MNLRPFVLGQDFATGKLHHRGNGNGGDLAIFSDFFQLLGGIDFFFFFFSGYLASPKKKLAVLWPGSVPGSQRSWNWGICGCQSFISVCRISVHSPLFSMLPLSSLPCARWSRGLSPSSSNFLQSPWDPAGVGKESLGCPACSLHWAPGEVQTVSPCLRVPPVTSPRLEPQVCSRGWACSWVCDPNGWLLLCDLLTPWVFLHCLRGFSTSHESSHTMWALPRKNPKFIIMEY